MQTALCRILIFLFAFNAIFSPGLQAQTAPSDWQQTVAQTIEEQADLSAEEEAWLLYYYSSVPDDIEYAVKRLHAVRERRSLRMNEPAPDARTIPASSTYVAKRGAVQPIKHTPGHSQVLNLLAQNRLAFEELIDFIDPLDPQDNHLFETVYAAEVLGNSVDAYAKQSAQELEYMLEWLPRAQQRILYRLNALKESGYALSAPYGIMALGSLRVALWKIHAFYEQIGRPDPLFKPAELLAERPAKPQPAETAGRFNPVQPADKTRVNIPIRRVPSSLREADVYQRMMEDFLSELTSLKNKKPDAEDSEYPLLYHLTRYAVLYTLSYNPGRLFQIVNLFDKGPGDKNFTQRYSPMLNNIFMVVFDTAKYTPQGSRQWNRLLELLQDFSDPKRYSVPTRVFALEAASLLFRPGAQTQFTRQTKDLFSQLFPNAKKPPYRLWLANNRGPTPESLRALFAKRTADLYCPTTYTHYLAVENYGCNTHELQSLADKLASIYDGFYDIDTTYVRPKDAPAPYRHPAQCTVVMNNKPNAHQQEMDANISFLTLSAEIFAWSAGLPAALSLFRFARGAVIALPEATKLASLAGKGRRLQAFGGAVKQSVHYQNTVSRLAKAGQTIKVTTAPKTSLPVKPGAAPTASTASNTQTVKSMHTLANKTWYGAPKNTRITGIEVHQHIPGFKTQTLSLSQEAAASGRLAQGVRNYDDLDFLRTNLQNAQGRTVLPGWSKAELKEARNQLWLGRAAYAAVNGGAFDAWLATPAGQWVNVRLSNGKLPWNKLSAQNGYGAIVTPRVPRAGFTDSPLAGGLDSFWGAYRADEAASFFQTLFHKPQAFGLPKRFFTDKLAGQGVRLNTQAPGLWQKAKNFAAGKRAPQNALTLLPENGEWAGSLAYSLLHNGQLDALNGYLLSSAKPWARFSATSKFFIKWGAGFALADHLFTSPFRDWSTRSYLREYNTALKDYGNTFSERELALDAAEQYAQRIDLLRNPQANPAASSQMLEFTPESSDPRGDIPGSSLSFPLLFVRNALHGMGIGGSVFLGEADRTQFTFTEHYTLQEREKLRSSAARRVKYTDWTNTLLEEALSLKKTLETSAQNKFGPQAAQELAELCDEYKDALVRLFVGPNTWKDQAARARTMQEEFFKKQNSKWHKYERLENARRQRLIATEEYTPFF